METRQRERRASLRGHRSLARLAEAGLYDAARRRVLSSAAEEFLIHGVPYIFPVRPQAETRGVPAAWAAPPLSDLLTSGDPLPPIWPAFDGNTRGLALEGGRLAAITRTLPSGVDIRAVSIAAKPRFLASSSTPEPLIHAAPGVSPHLSHTRQK